MSIIEIRPAQREGARLVIGLAAPTGQGKTYSAILFAYGLANYDASKVGFLDAENRRGSLYADILQSADPATDTPFLIADLFAPFSPRRYTASIQEFQSAGIEVLVIDSVTHEHEGPGGLIEIADGGPEHPTPNKYWNRAKGEHKMFMSALLQSDMHIIVCVRAREKSEPTETIVNGQKKKGYQDLGMQPITEKNFMFEMTASLMMFEEGRRQETMKMPAALRPYLGRLDGYLTPADGKAVRDWVDGAKQLDPQVEKYRNRLLSRCSEGVAFIEEAWRAKTPEEIRAALGEKFHATLVASATAFDEQKKESEANTAADPASASALAAKAAGPTAAEAIAAIAAQGAAAKEAQVPPQKAAVPTDMQPKATAPAAKVAAPATAAKPSALESLTGTKARESSVTTLRPTASVVVTHHQKAPVEAPKAALPLATPAAVTKKLEDPIF